MPSFILTILSAPYARRSMRFECQPLSSPARTEIFNLSGTCWCAGQFSVPAMHWVGPFSSTTAATQIRLAAVLALAAVSFLFMAAVVNTQRQQVDERTGSIASITDDVNDDRGDGPSWRCANVPVTVQCPSEIIAVVIKGDTR